MSRMITLVFVIALSHFLILDNAARADVLVTGPANVFWDPSSEASPTYTMSIETSPASGVMSSWNLSLRIIPSAGATGEVGMSTLSVPSSDYIFSGVGLGLMTPSLVPPSSTADPVLDATFPPVPLPATATLLDITFAEIAAADGVFRLEILPFSFPDAGSFWHSDPFLSPFPIPFDNDFSAGPALIGTITIGSQGTTAAVPEPHTFISAVLATLCMAMICYRGQRTWSRK